MSGTYATQMGNRGRLVVPSELRRRHGLTDGAPVVIVDSADGVILMSQEEAKSYVRRQLGGTSLAGSLETERRADASLEDQVSTAR